MSVENQPTQEKPKRHAPSTREASIREALIVLHQKIGDLNLKARELPSRTKYELAERQARYNKNERIRELAVDLIDELISFD